MVSNRLRISELVGDTCRQRGARASKQSTVSQKVNCHRKDITAMVAQKIYENREHRPKYMVSDLLIHSRGPERNLLAIELKRKGNRKNIDSDKERLASLVSSPSPNSPNMCVHDTLIGAFIIYSPNEVRVDIFENINGIGTETDHIVMDYNQLIH